MNYKAFTEQFLLQVNKLEKERQLQLGLFVCKELYPDYDEFEKENAWGNSKLMIDTINSMEHSGLLGQRGFDLKERMSEIEAVTPDTEDFDNASYALNACVAILHTLEYLNDFDPQNIYYIGVAFVDTVDSKIQDENDLSEDEIDNHVEMLRVKNLLLKMSES
jgi:uncharacterized protein YjaG (DUF416 family)